ncbi:AMP-binding enzyme [Histoplasma capsulatum H143]|uniref:AMP-binding enzyme n=1 Tax=Ajellomyces capsulatus (strain H143) TaxID=544712 RepID=C6HFQ2_AJECH|nr:AMP-binding enzyme [Histoplasma capsulatum H143]
MLGALQSVISTHQAQRLTYDELDRKSNALARGLAAGGLPKGDRVAVSLGNSIEFAIVTYALFKLGAVLVPLNPSFNANQVVSALGHLEASHLIMSTEVNLPRREPRPTLSLLQQIVPDLLSSKLESQAVPSLKKIILVNNDDGRVDTTSFKCTTPFASLSSDLIQDMLPIAPQGLSPHDVVNIQFTSGTTSMPKAACLTHRSILNNGVQIGDQSFNAIATLKAVQDERCTALYGVPTMFVEELDLLEEGKSCFSDDNNGRPH